MDSIYGYLENRVYTNSLQRFIVRDDAKIFEYQLCHFCIQWKQLDSNRKLKNLSIIIRSDENINQFHHTSESFPKHVPGSHLPVNLGVWIASMIFNHLLLTPLLLHKDNMEQQ